MKSRCTISRPSWCSTFIQTIKYHIPSIRAHSIMMIMFFLFILWICGTEYLIIACDLYFYQVLTVSDKYPQLKCQTRIVYKNSIVVILKLHILLSNKCTKNLYSFLCAYNLISLRYMYIICLDYLEKIYFCCNIIVLILWNKTLFLCLSLFCQLLSSALLS